MARAAPMGTVFHQLDRRGYFDNNPANVQSTSEDGVQLYKGPVEYPKMLYSPTGEYKVTVPGEWVDTPIGPRLRGQVKELVHKIVQNQIEELAALSEGWHLAPGAALRAAGEDVAETPAEIIARQQAEMEQMRRTMETMKAAHEAGETAPTKGLASLTADAGRVRMGAFAPTLAK